MIVLLCNFEEAFLALAKENTSVCPTSCGAIETLKCLSLPWGSTSSPYLEKLLPCRQFFLDFIYLETGTS